MAENASKYGIMPVSYTHLDVYKRQAYSTTCRRLYRNPDDNMLGGVISGMAAYLGWDVTLLRRLLLVVLICGVGTLIPVYIVCWLIIPEARTAAEKMCIRDRLYGHIARRFTFFVGQEVDVAFLFHLLADIVQ